jgi:hypothetical protein
MIRKAVLLTLLVFFLFSSYAHSDSTHDIFQWVAVELDTVFDGNVPEIRTVDKTSLKSVFQKNNRKSYLRWQARYGVLEAERIMSIYLREVIGLFDPKSNTIYIADWLDPCRLQSILAHEATHFFQYKTRPLENQTEISAANQRLRWEIEAHQIEQRFIELHCAEHAASKNDP